MADRYRRRTTASELAEEVRAEEAALARARAAPPALLDVDPQELPEPLLRWLDPAQPLPEPERFVFGHVDSLVGSSLMLLLAAALGVPAIRALGGDATGASFAFRVVFLVAIVLWAAWSARKLLRAYGQRRAIAAGRYRRGLYALDDHLLLYDGRRASAIPRRRIIEVHHYVERGHRGRRYAGKSYVAYPDADGATQRRTLPMVAAPRLAGGKRAESGPVFVALEGWLESGRIRRTDLWQEVPLAESAVGWSRTLVLGHLALSLAVLTLTVVAPFIALHASEILALLAALFVTPIAFVALCWLGGRLWRPPRLAEGAELPFGWGYLLLLGLAALILGLGTYFENRDLPRMALAGAVREVRVERLVDHRGSGDFLEVLNARVLSQVEGRATIVSRTKNSTSTSTYRVWPVVASDVEPAARPDPCVWLTADDGDSGARDLPESDALWLLEQPWDGDAYDRAVSDALVGARPGCEPMFVRPTAPPEVARGGARRKLGWFLLLGNALPPVLLLGWALYRLDQPRDPALRRSRSSDELLS